MGGKRQSRPGEQISRKEIDARYDVRLSRFEISSTSIPSRFVVSSFDTDGRGGYARGAHTKNVIRFDICTHQLTRSNGVPVLMRAMDEIDGTLAPTGMAWRGHELPIAALEFFRSSIKADGPVIETSFDARLVPAHEFGALL